MTQAKAQTVVGNLVAQGYQAEAVPNPDGSWWVFASSPGTTVDVAAINTFATNNAVTGKTDRAIFL